MGTRLATWSIVCALATLPMYLVGYGVGTLLMALLDVPEGDKITTAGVGGWIAGVALIALLAAPGVAGLVLGLRARREGGGRRALIGIGASAVLGGWVLVAGAAGLLFS